MMKATLGVIMRVLYQPWIRGEESEAALNTGLKVLRGNGLFGIYPEGTRSPDGRLYRGKTGVARLALESQVPVVPVVMVGTDRVQPIGRTIPHIRRVGVVIGKPLDFSRYEGMENDRLAASRSWRRPTTSPVAGSRAG